MEAPCEEPSPQLQQHEVALLAKPELAPRNVQCSVPASLQRAMADSSVSMDACDFARAHRYLQRQRSSGASFRPAAHVGAAARRALTESWSNLNTGETAKYRSKDVQ